MNVEIKCNNCNCLINNILILDNINVCPFCYEILNINNKIDNNYLNYHNLIDTILSNNIIKQLTSKLDKENKNWYWIAFFILINLIILTYIYYIFK